MSKDDELRYGAPRNAVHISVDRPRRVPHQPFFNRPSMWFGIEPFLGDRLSLSGLFRHQNLNEVGAVGHACRCLNLPADLVHRRRQLFGRGGDGVHGTDVAMESAGVSTEGHLTAIMRARRLSRETISTIRQNLFFAFAYNAAGIPIAADASYPTFGLLLSPIVAARAWHCPQSVSWVTHCDPQGSNLDEVP